MTHAPLHSAPKPRQRRGVETVPVGTEAIVVSADRMDLHALNPTAALVWNCLDGTSTVAEIADDLADAMQVDADVVSPHVVALVDRLIDDGLLDAEANGAPDEGSDAATAGRDGEDLRERAYVAEPPSS